MKQFKSGQSIGAYKVVFPLPNFGQRQAYYRVVDAFGNKLYLYLRPTQECIGNSKFSEYLRHEALLTLVDSGVADVDGVSLGYRVFEFVSGETLACRLDRQRQLHVYEAKNTVTHLLNLIRYLRGRSSRVFLNGLSPSDILLGFQDNGIKLLDLSDTPSPLYQAPECIGGKSVEERSEVYVVGILFYLMIFGQYPWKSTPHSKYNVASITKLDEERRQPLAIPDYDIFELDDSTVQILRKALAYNIQERYTCASDMLSALEQRGTSPRNPALVKPSSSEKEAQSETADVQDSKGDQPHGFVAVAGMRDLKAYLTSNVINLLRHTERARRYRIHIPNGMLLYGPPGCGKSFFAEKFAEEVGYSSIYVKASDLASIYVHGSQSKIKELFDEARKKAPTVICFDEFDALVPSRNNSLGSHQYGEVNEFLSQLNNCGQDGIFVIASTNKPELIDPAVMRRGRIDRIVYLPAPDEEARRELFLLYLRGRPCASGIDILRLSKMTDGYVCSDIAGIVNDAAIAAAERDELLTQQSLERIINSTPPSVSRSTLDFYEQLEHKLRKARH